MLGHRDSLAVTGLTQARRLQNAVAPTGEQQNSILLLLLHQELDTYFGPIITLLHTLRALAP
jgi:hypothetical protein